MMRTMAAVVLSLALAAMLVPGLAEPADIGFVSIEAEVTLYD